MAVRTPLLATACAALASLCSPLLASVDPVLPPPPAPPVTHAEHADSPTKIAIVQVPLPAPGDSWSLSDLPEAVSKLLLEGWRIREVREAGRSLDGKDLELVLVLDREPQVSMAIPGGGTMDLPPGLPGFPGNAFRFFNGPNQADGGPGSPVAPMAPGAGAPVGPLDKGTITVHWQDGHLSTITVGEALGARAKAHVVTTDASGKALAEYDATAFKDAQGMSEVDGRGAPLSGNPGSYIPDSFRIHGDGTVEIQDDQGNRDQGRTDHAAVPHADAPAADHQL